MSFYDDASLIFLAGDEAGKDGKAYSVKPTDGSGDFTFSRGSNLTATRVDSNGLIEKGRENLLLQSNNFDTTWGSVNTTETSGEAGYDGSNDAWLLTKDATTFARVQQTLDTPISGVWTMSAYLKAGTATLSRFRFNSASYMVEFNFSTGVATDEGSVSAIDFGMTDVGNGWYRCYATFNASVSIAQIYVDYNTSTSTTMFVQDAQLEQGLVATEYIESGASTGLAGILEDSPRFDYSGGASCPSLLLEPSRTNLVEYSEYIEGNTSQGFTNATKEGFTESPEGLNNAYEINVITPNENAAYDLGRFNTTIGADYTYSVYLKSSGTFDARIYAARGTTEVKNIVVTSEWQRFDLTFTSDNADKDLIVGFGDFNFANPAQTISIYGLQFENATYPTSYIPNHSGGSVTREADDSTLSSIINGDAAFTFMIESGIQDYGDSVPKYFDAGALGYINHNTSNTLRYRFGGSNYVQSISGLDSFKFLLRYDRSEIKVYFNGSLEHTISASLSGSIGLSLLGGLNKQVLLFPTDLPLNQCITLTS